MIPIDYRQSDLFIDSGLASAEEIELVRQRRELDKRQACLDVAYQLGDECHAFIKVHPSGASTRDIAKYYGLPDGEVHALLVSAIAKLREIADHEGWSADEVVIALGRLG